MKRKRVVLLGAPARARERTQAAIVDAGGDVVACLTRAKPTRTRCAPPIPAC